MDPSTRLTAEQALAHPYLKDYSDATDEPMCDVQVVSDQFEAVYSAGDHLEISTWKGMNPLICI